MKCVTSFLDYLQYQRRFSPHTLAAYRTDLKQFERYLSEVYALDDPAGATHHHIRSWLVSLLSQGLSDRSLRRKSSALRAFYRFFRKRGTVAQDPMQNVPRGNVPRQLPAVARRGELLALIEAGPAGDSFSARRDHFILELLYSTGMRRSELLGLRPEDIDRAKGHIRVLGKGQKERLIPMGNWLLESLRDYLAARTEAFGEAANLPLLLTDKGRPLYPKKVYLIVKRYLAQLGTAEQKSPHALRHAFATHLMEQGADLQAVKELLGHSSLAATEIYTRNTVERLRKTYQQAHPKARRKSGE